jgi:hypothetical protein
LEIWTAPIEGDIDHPRLGKAEPFLRTASSARGPAFSPDGRWLAYSSDETGTEEVYVQPFPGPGQKLRISAGGGRFPVWSRRILEAERELFFLAPDGRIMVAGYTANSDSFAPGEPRVWSQRSLVVGEITGPPFDLAADGRRFAVVLFPGATAEEQKPVDSVTVLLNFFDYLRGLVPGGGK